ncbi:ATP-binding protein [Streptomyces sp. NBC_01476]|uniref:ATP-binding protein n=1 Tax=Streptomyces sp. NBC_01476 TaxID=2903881 RepID=UPI002E2FC448|nr:ATP-binding protein [Streptomyces sp. NBC_01476]
MPVKAVGWARSFPVSEGVKAGRDWARTHLDMLGWTQRAPDTADDVLLAVSELITNAHVHAHSDAHVVLVWDGKCLRVSVGDSSAQLPAPRSPDPERTSGRGMALIEALADDWEAHTKPDGKTVTAAFSFALPDCPD